MCLDFQGPDCLNQEKVFRLVEALRRRKKLEPLVVYFGRETYWLADGFHRFAAAHELRRKTILAEVRRGTLEEMEAEFRRSQDAALADLRANGKNS